MQFPIYIGLGAWRIHPHFLFESLAYAAAFRLLLLNVRSDTIKTSQRSSVMVGGMVGALLGAKALVLLQHIDQRCVRGVTFQPIQAAGRLEGFEPKCDRYTLTEVRRAILKQSPHFQAQDILPVPCHPDSLAMAYALKLKGQVIPLTGLFDTATFVDMMPNSVLYEQHPELKKRIFDLFSTSHSPVSVAASLKQLLCCLPLVVLPDGFTYENIFRIMIVQFMDAYNFDVRSVKRSCIHIAHPDGRLIPFDTYNLFYREGSVSDAQKQQIK